MLKSWGRLAEAFTFLVIYKLAGFAFLPFLSVFWSGLLADVVGIVLGVCLYRRSSDFDLKRSKDRLPSITLTVIAVWLLLQFMIALLLQGVEFDRPEREHLWLTILVTLVAAPLCEELLFRGVLFRTLRDVAPFWVSALVSSVVFGLFHGTVPQMIAATVSGLFFAMILEQTGSLVFSIYAHFLFNLMSVVVLIPTTGWAQFGLILIAAVGTAHAVFGGSLCLVLFCRKQRPPMTGVYLESVSEDGTEVGS